MESSELTFGGVQVLREHINNPWNQQPATMKNIKELSRGKPHKMRCTFCLEIIGKKRRYDLREVLKHYNNCEAVKGVIACS